MKTYIVFRENLIKRVYTGLTPLMTDGSFLTEAHCFKCLLGLKRIQELKWNALAINRIYRFFLKYGG